MQPTPNRLSAEEISRIAQEVKENHALLNSCPYHDFQIIPGTDIGRLRLARFQCLHCHGQIDGQQHYWHELGRRPKP